MAVQWFNPYYVFGGEGGSGTGKVFTKTENGLVPAPGASAGDDLVLRSDGTWGQGGGGSATVGLGKQAKQAMWPGEYTKISQTPLPTIGQWDFKDPEDFYKEIQDLPGYGVTEVGKPSIYLNKNVSYMLEYLREADVKASIIKFIEYCNAMGWPLIACWNANSSESEDSTLYIYTFQLENYYPFTGQYTSGRLAVRSINDNNSAIYSSTRFFYQKFNIPESEGITLPSTSKSGEFSNVKITESCLKLHARTTGTEVNKKGMNNDIATNYASAALDAQDPTPEDNGKKLPYSPNIVCGCLSANISGYNNYGTLSSIKYDKGNLTFVNTQGATVITMPGATATGEDELTLNDLQKIVYNEESSPKKLEIYDKTGTLRFTVNDTSSGT